MSAELVLTSPNGSKIIVEGNVAIPPQEAPPPPQAPAPPPSDANQQWQFTDIGSGYVKIMVRHSNKFLACHDTKENADVYQYDYYTGGAKDWKLECLNNGYFRLQHRLSGKYLSIESNSTANEADAVIKSWTNHNSQQWQIVEVPCATTQNLVSSTNLTFNAAAEPTRSRLSWVSNLGANTDYFTIEKQDNVTGEFVKLETINNKFVDNEAHYFTAYDVKPTEGDNIYRIELTLNDGTTKLTETQAVVFKGLYAVRLFPNPASDEVQVDLSAYAGTDVSLFVYNFYGKQVAYHNLQNVSKQPFMMDINTVGVLCAVN